MNDDRADPEDTNGPRPAKSMRGVVPLEDVVMPVVFIVAIAFAVFGCRHWLGLPWWGSALLGVPSGFLFVLGAVWLLSQFSKRRP